MNVHEIWRAAVKQRADALGMSADEAISLAVYAFARGNPLLDADKLKPFQEYSELTGTPVEDLIETAMENYVECDLAALLEELTERTDKA
jgi:hypothetical protein